MQNILVSDNINILSRVSTSLYSKSYVLLACLARKTLEIKRLLMNKFQFIVVRSYLEKRSVVYSLTSSVWLEELCQYTVYINLFSI